MKTFAIAVLTAFLGLTQGAAATTLGFSVEATSQTLGGVTDVIFHFDVIGDPNVTFTPTNAFIDFGDGFSQNIIAPPATSPAFVSSYIYSVAGVYSVTGVLSGYFSDDAAIYDFGNGTSVIISGFSDIPGTPIPAALPLFATALGALGFAAWRGRRTRMGQTLAI